MHRFWNTSNKTEVSCQEVKDHLQVGIMRHFHSDSDFLSSWSFGKSSGMKLVMGAHFGRLTPLAAIFKAVELVWTCFMTIQEVDNRKQEQKMKGFSVCWSYKRGYRAKRRFSPLCLRNSQPWVSGIQISTAARSKNKLIFTLADATGLLDFVFCHFKSITYLSLVTESCIDNTVALHWGLKAVSVFTCSANSSFAHSSSTYSTDAHILVCPSSTTRFTTTMCTCTTQFRSYCVVNMQKQNRFLNPLSGLFSQIWRSRVLFRLLCLHVI